MCGITGYAGTADAVPKLVSSLESLEYRGYDSAGVAVRNGERLVVCKHPGKISLLKRQIEAETPSGTVGIGHTRWSTHGVPNAVNAHPHTDCSGRVAVVHNGIIENYDALAASLERRGHSFVSETDTEVVPHLVEEYLNEGLSTSAAFRRAVDELDGRYAIAMVVDDENTIYATRRGSPLLLGVGTDGNYLASDVSAFLAFTDAVVYLEDGDIVELTGDAYHVSNLSGMPLVRSSEIVGWAPESTDKVDYDHYMLKEIYEQPTSLGQTLTGRLDLDAGNVVLEEFEPDTFADVREVHFLACGTSYHASLYAAQFLLERGIRAQAFLASEYVTTPTPADECTLAVAVSQSGETADTLEAVRRARAAGARTVAVTNVVGSSASRECDDSILIRAGPEIGVAATKTFSSQVATLLVLAERVKQDVTGVPSADLPELLDSLAALPLDVQRILESGAARALADQYVGYDGYFFIGRGLALPVALEGALKFKEITYDHAEGFAAGELKHGPLALVTPRTPVFAVFSGQHTEKTLNNVKEVQARGAPIVAVACRDDLGVANVADGLLAIPRRHPAVAGILANVQLQLVAYHVAALYGREIDMPRNLAKSVTVE